eukprot:m.94420 g.94420  ORF g.94420 m.94420 type:complete len:940 (+) comp26719_c0_seq1:260-3079(+)
MSRRSRGSAHMCSKSGWFLRKVHLQTGVGRKRILDDKKHFLEVWEDQTIRWFIESANARGREPRPYGSTVKCEEITVSTQGELLVINEPANPIVAEADGDWFLLPIDVEGETPIAHTAEDWLSIFSTTPIFEDVPSPLSPTSPLEISAGDITSPVGDKSMNGYFDSSDIHATLGLGLDDLEAAIRAKEHQNEVAAKLEAANDTRPVQSLLHDAIMNSTSMRRAGMGGTRFRGRANTTPILETETVSRKEVIQVHVPPLEHAESSSQPIKDILDSFGLDRFTDFFASKGFTCQLHFATKIDDDVHMRLLADEAGMDKAQSRTFSALVLQLQGNRYMAYTTVAALFGQWKLGQYSDAFVNAEGITKGETLLKLTPSQLAATATKLGMETGELRRLENKLQSARLIFAAKDAPVQETAMDWEPRLFPSVRDRATTLHDKLEHRPNPTEIEAKGELFKTALSDVSAVVLPTAREMRTERAESERKPKLRKHVPKTNYSNRHQLYQNRISVNLENKIQDVLVTAQFKKGDLCKVAGRGRGVVVSVVQDPVYGRPTVEVALQDRDEVVFVGCEVLTLIDETTTPNVKFDATAQDKQPGFKEVKSRLEKKKSMTQMIKTATKRVWKKHTTSSKTKKKTGSITKLQIGAPANFEHVGHIGYDSHNTADMMDQLAMTPKSPIAAGSKRTIISTPLNVVHVTGMGTSPSSSPPAPAPVSSANGLSLTISEDQEEDECSYIEVIPDELPTANKISKRNTMDEIHDIGDELESMQLKLKSMTKHRQQSINDRKENKKIVDEEQLKVNTNTNMIVNTIGKEPHTKAPESIAVAAETFHCAQCDSVYTNATDGASDEIDSQWYCNPCWEANQKLVCGECNATFDDEADGCADGTEWFCNSCWQSELNPDLVSPPPSPPLPGVDDTNNLSDDDADDVIDHDAVPESPKLADYDC